MIYADNGILKARATKALKELAELAGIRVAHPPDGPGAFPDSRPLCLGMPGMHGNYAAVTSMQRSDLLVAPAPTSTPGHRQGRCQRPRRQIIHVDIDPAELGKVRRPDVPIVDDCKAVIEEMSRRSATGQPSPTAREWTSS